MKVAFTPDVLRQLDRLRLYDQRKIVQAIRTHLIENDPMQETQNKFRLERPSQHADFELGVESLRIFYRIDEAGDLYITIIGTKEGNRLLVKEKEFEL